MRYPAEVTWVDAHATTTTWTASADLDICDRVIRSVGWVIHRDARHLVLALSVDRDADAVDSVITIPAVCVRRIDRLTRPLFRRAK